MDLVSIIFIVIILLSAIIGVIKGFINSVIGFIGQIFVLLLSFIVTNFVSPFILKFGFINNLHQTINNNLCGMNEIFSQVFYKDNPQLISDALDKINIPNIINSLLTDQIINIIPENGVTLGYALSSSITQIIVNIICFIVLYLIFKLLLTLTKKLTKNLMENVQPLKKLDKFLGFVLGSVIGLIIVDVLCLLITFSLSMPGFENFNNILIQQMKLNNEAWTLSKFLYENNLLLLIVAWLT